MNRSLLVLSFALLAVACNKPAEQTAAPSAATTTTSAPAPAPAPVPAPVSTPSPATPSAGALATQETNWNGITAEVTEFRRKGNTLTAKVRFTNHGSQNPQVEIQYGGVSLIDTGAGKKYAVLKDEKDESIAALSQNWHDRWFKNLHPGESQVIWMKFPAPPAETKAITLQIPNTPPFEDVAIQD